MYLEVGGAKERSGQALWKMLQGEGGAEEKYRVMDMDGKEGVGGWSKKGRETGEAENDVMGQKTGSEKVLETAMLGEGIVGKGRNLGRKKKEALQVNRKRDGGRGRVQRRVQGHVIWGGCSRMRAEPSKVCREEHCREGCSWDRDRHGGEGCSRERA